MISIIIPTFNRADLLHDALDPLLCWAESVFECIVVDDGSTDETGSVIRILRKRSPQTRLLFLEQETNQGAQAARNRGIEAATGEFLLFLDSDDVPRPDGIMDLYKSFHRNPDLGFCFGRVQKTGSLLNSLTDHDYVGSAFGAEPREIAGYHWHTMGALYRRSCVERVGPWNVELTGSQDWEYQARVKLSGGRGEFVDTLVGYWRQHDGKRVGTSRFRPDYVRSVMIACESILSKARESRRCDSRLEERIAKKLVCHALEWGTNGYLKERKECFEQAASSLTGSVAFAAAIRAWSSSPAFTDAPIMKFLARR